MNEINMVQQKIILAVVEGVKKLIQYLITELNCTFRNFCYRYAVNPLSVDPEKSSVAKNCSEVVYHMLS